MGLPVRELAGGQYFLNDFFISANIAAGATLILESTASDIGEVQVAAATAAADFVGCSLDAATFNATPTEEPSQVRQENLVRCPINPHIVYRYQVSGGATSNTALQPSTATPANILVNDTVDATKKIITDTAVGTVDMSGGIVKGRLGRNVGVMRKLVSQVASTSATAGLPFLNALAVGDQFIRLPWSRHAVLVTLTTDTTQANGIVAYGAGATFSVVNVVIDEVRSRAWVDVVSRDSYLSPESV